MKTTRLLLASLITAGLFLCSFVVNSQAQPITQPPAAPTIAGININALIPNLVGQVITYKGQSFLISTNADGSYVVSTFGVQGTNAIVVPTTPQQAFEVASAWINANNPANSGYYGTNEIVAELGAAYLQNSGQTVAFISVTKYGLFGWQWLGVGAGVLQGNNGTSIGTAGFYGKAVYRKVIGDVAAEGGLIFGYDEWSSQILAGVEVGVEHRQSNHIGEFVKLIYAFEPGASSDKGLAIAGGLDYAF